MQELIDLPSIIESNLLFDDEIHALKLYVEGCHDDDKAVIASYLGSKIINDDLKIVTQTLEPTTMVAHILTLQALTTKKAFCQADEEQLKALLPKVLQIHKRAKTAIYDIQLFAILYQYTKRREQPNKWVIFHYLSAILSTIGGFDFDRPHVAISPSDIDVYLAYLNDEAFLSKSMYEELIEHGL